MVLGARLVRVNADMRRLQVSAVSVFAILWLMITCFHGVVATRTDEFKEENALYRSLSHESLTETPLLVYRIDPAQALFYRRGPVEFVSSLEQLNSRAQASSRGLLVTQAGLEAELLQVASPVRLTETTRSERNPEAQLIVYSWRTPVRVSHRHRHLTVCLDAKSPAR